jgi:hypothetical protein
LNTDTTDRRKKIALWILIPATVLFLASLVSAGTMIMFSPMAFDSGAKPETWRFVITLLIYPVVVLLTIAAAWISFAVRGYRVATWLNLLPILHILVLVVELISSG